MIEWRNGYMIDHNLSHTEAVFLVDVEASLREIFLKSVFLKD